MTEDRGSPRLTNTYQSVLMNCLNATVMALNQGDVRTARRTLETLRAVLKPKIREKLNIIWEKFEHTIGESKKRSGVDTYETRQIRANETWKVVEQNLIPLLAEIIDVLDQGKYLETEYIAISEESFDKMEQEQKDEPEI